MKRRSAIKNLGLFAGGLVLFPSCDFSDEKTSFILNKLNINKSDEDIVNLIIDTILPNGKSPGGTALKVQNFVWAMIDDCTEKNDQDKFLNGLRSFNTVVKSNFNNEFNLLNSTEKTTVIQTLLSEKSTDQSVQEFLKTVKHLSIWGYQNTEFFLTKKKNFQLVPGPLSYKTVNIEDAKKLNSNG